MKITKSQLKQIIKEELGVLKEYDPTHNPDKIPRIAKVLKELYPDTIPVIQAYLETIDMLNNEFRRDEGGALYDALENMGDIEQPIMAAVRLMMEGL